MHGGYELNYDPLPNNQCPGGAQNKTKQKQ
jgi:hypothetical protein